MLLKPLKKAFKKIYYMSKPFNPDKKTKTKTDLVKSELVNSQPTLKNIRIERLICSKIICSPMWRWLKKRDEKNFNHPVNEVIHGKNLGT